MKEFFHDSFMFKRLMLQRERFLSFYPNLGIRFKCKPCHFTYFNRRESKIVYCCTERILFTKTSIPISLLPPSSWVVLKRAVCKMLGYGLGVACGKVRA